MSGSTTRKPPSSFSCLRSQSGQDDGDLIVDRPRAGLDVGLCVATDEDGRTWVDLRKPLTDQLQAVRVEAVGGPVSLAADQDFDRTGLPVSAPGEGTRRT